jgi:putative transposase
MEHRGWASRGYLPHCDGADLIQHIVFGTMGAGDEIEKNFGERLLDHPQAAETVEGALLHFDDERYRLWAWCIMSNHVHVVVQQQPGWRLSRIIHSWKSFTANQINKIHGRTGPVWHREYFDRFMRNDAELVAVIEYVEQNPVRAGLVSRATDWRWSSARLR